jgi:hypothetical protein
VRRDLLGRFSPDGLLIQFLTLMDKHRTSNPILSRLCYVFADFAAHEPELLGAAGRLMKPVDIAMIPQILETDEARADCRTAAMIVQVIANLSVSEECAALLTLSGTVARALIGRTFTADDRFGFNLLCTASNFAYHNRTWSPPELIAAIPVAIVSKHIPSILEALRTLCNIALAQNALLIESKIPELLGILVMHVDPDVELYALQVLANLVNHGAIRRRFRDGGYLTHVLELLKGDSIDELLLEAIAALVMNFGAISADEASEFAAALDEFELDRSNQIVASFIDFLNNRANG